MKVVINGKEYMFLSNYQKQTAYRDAFCILAKKIFGIGFEDWYLSGYWQDKYIPYTLFHDETAIANVSINLMKFEVLNIEKFYIQIGTVMTDENYRHQNLCLFLMEMILNEWRDKCDLIYLFGNNTVFDFYPKFNFKKITEYECFKSVNKTLDEQDFDKLNMDLQSNRDMLNEYIMNSKSIAKVSMLDNAGLIMFYAISLYKNDIYYIKSLDVIAVALFKNDELHLLDVFSHTHIDIDKVIYALLNPAIRTVRLGFTPKNPFSYQQREIKNDEATFVMGKDLTLFEENKMMFPLLSHA